MFPKICALLRAVGSFFSGREDLLGMYMLDGPFFLFIAIGLWVSFLSQVLMKTKCTSQHRRAGRPRQDPESERKGVNHGWFVAVDRQSAKIMGMTPLDKPENNKTAIGLLKELVVWMSTQS